MLWLSEELQARGWHVTHVTVGYSPLSRLSRDGRLTALDTPPRPGVRQLSPTLTATFAPTPLHPFGTRRRWLDALLHPVLATFPLWLRRRLRPLVRGAELVVVESGPPVLLAPLVRRHAPRAQLVYRVNDDVRCLGLPRWLARAELRYAPVFDRISTASPGLPAGSPPPGGCGSIPSACRPGCSTAHTRTRTAPAVRCVRPCAPAPPCWTCPRWSALPAPGRAGGCTSWAG
nr:hypothetical protein [Tranquillimonas alkanivorans]